MECPRCELAPRPAGPYRESASLRPEHPTLVDEKRAEGPLTARCPNCGGAFLAAGALQAIENAVRRKASVDGREMLRRAFARPHQEAEEEKPPLRCPSCNDEMIEREWSIGTLVFVDVCLECRGVWVDGGELEALLVSFGGD